MPSQDIRIPASDASGEFDCYLVTPDSPGPVPAVVLASAVHGVDHDVRAIADEFGREGYIAAAPDLFWRSVPGPLARGDERTTGRSQPRPEKIRAGEADMADTLKRLGRLPAFNGRAAAMGFCYGGPYAILGPARLGYDAGISCHGTRMLDYIDVLADVTKPVSILWGDQDHQAPPEVLDAYRKLAGRKPNIDLHIFPGVKHGYMMPGGAEAYDAKSREFSMARALEILTMLR